jgi:fusion and transport protein UGO1
LPIETIRRRLQIQPRGNGKPMATCVHTRRQPYYGVVDAFWRILSEECSDGCPLTSKDRDPTRREKRARSPSWYSRHGLGQLYRGLGMGVGAGITVLVLTFVTGAGTSNSGWTEL